MPVPAPWFISNAYRQCFDGGGLVIVSTPGSWQPLAIVAFSAQLVIKSTFFELKA